MSLAIISGAASLVSGSNPLKSAQKVFGNIFGGKSPNCDADIKEMEDLMSTYLTSSDLRNLRSSWIKTVGGKPHEVSATARSLASAFAGGGDCRVTSSGGKSWNIEVNNLLQKRINDSASGGGNPTVTTSTGGGSVTTSAGFIPGVPNPVSIIVGIILALFGLKKFKIL